MRILKVLSTYPLLSVLLAIGSSRATVSRSTLNCKYQLIPEFVDCIGLGNHELYYSETRGIRHEPENKVLLNVRYPSVVSVSLERSFDSDLEFSYLQIVRAESEDLVAEGNLTWGVAGNNTRLFLRTVLDPSQYLLVIGSSFVRNEDGLEKIDNSYCSPISFEFGLTTPEILSSLSSLSLNDPFKKPLVSLSSDEKYEYSNQVDDPFVVRTITQGINNSSRLYRATILWSKLFTIPTSRSKEEKLLNLYVELGFKFSRMPLQLIIEPLGVSQTHRELESHQINQALHGRVFFGTPIYNGQLFKGSVSQKSFRLVIVAPWMESAPRFAQFDLRISISFHTHSEKLSRDLLSSQNVCSLPKLPTKIVQDGLTSERVQDLRTPNAVPAGHLFFGPKFNLQGPFESLTSHTNHVIHIQISRPSVFYLLSYHDHSDIAVALSRSPEISKEDEDLEFFDDILDSEEDVDHHAAGRSTLCTSRNLNHAGVTSREMNLIYCKIAQPGDYYLHIHSYRISETQNSVPLCTPLHLLIEVFPAPQSASGCGNPVSLRSYGPQISPDANAPLKRSSVALDSSSSPGPTASEVSKIHTREFRVKDLTRTYLSIQLRIPEHPLSLAFINVLYKNKVWLTLTPHTLHDFFASVGPLVAGTYQLQLFAAFPENSDFHEQSCIQFDQRISLVQLPAGPAKDQDRLSRAGNGDEHVGSEESPFVKCQMSHMTLPREIDLTQYSRGEEYILDGTFLAPLDEYETQESSGSIAKSAFIAYTTTIRLSLPSVLKVSITSYPGVILIHSGRAPPAKMGPNDSSPLFVELAKGAHDLTLEFDILEEGVDERLEEGGCPTFRLHLSAVSTEDLPVFPPLLLPRLYEYVTGSGRRSKGPSEWSHTELLSVSRDYLSKMFPGGSLALRVSRSVDSSPPSRDDILVSRGDYLEIREMTFWFSPFMQIQVPLESEVEDVGLSLVLEVYPAWTPITVRLLVDSGKKTKHNLVRYKSVLQTGNKVEYSFPSIKEGSYSLAISSKGQFSKLTMGRSALLKICGSLKPALKNRLFSLRQELISIPDILPFQQLPDSLNRIRFLSEPSRGLVSTLMLDLKEGGGLTRLKVPEAETYLLRILSEPTLVSGYELYVVIFKTKEGDKELKNHPVFRSGKYGDTLVLLSSGEYSIHLSPAPNSMPYLVTFGLVKFSPAEYEDFFRKNLSLSRSAAPEELDAGVGTAAPGRIRGTKDSPERGVSERSKREAIFGPKQKCHHYLENFSVHLNEENSPYFNSGVINICQGRVTSRSRPSSFSSNVYDLKLNVASSSVVYLQTRSDFLYSFYRIGIIVPEGFWVAEQRGSQSYLEVELTQGQYMLRIESLNSFWSYEEHEMLLFSVLVEVSPIDGSETALDVSKVVDHSLDTDTSRNRGLSHSNTDSKCRIPNGVPLPLDLTSIQGGSTVFGGPVDTNKPMFLLRSRITLTDIHNGRKKVFLELSKKLFPTFIRLSLSPVNFDISESPNMLEVLFTKINSTPISHIYTNVDSLLNSVEKVFKIDADVIGGEHSGLLNIPFWVTFTHKFDSMSSRIPCLAFDLIIHTVSPQSKDLQFSGPPPPQSIPVDSWFSSVQARLDRTLSAASSLPQYVHLPPSDVVISLSSDEFESDLLLDLGGVSAGQALLIADLYYNPLLVSSKLTLYSESPGKQAEREEERGGDDSYPDITLIKSSSLHFNGNLSAPLYAMERLTAVLTAQKHLLECSIKSLPPFSLRHVPVMLGVSIVPINSQVSKKHPLIVSISPPPSVPVIAGQNLHLTIQLSVPLRGKKEAPGRISKSIYLAARSESGPGERVSPYDVQVLDAGHTISISYSYLELAKVLLDNQDQFSRRGFLVINANNLPPNGSTSLYKPAPWISVFLEENNRFFIQISSYKANAVGWGNVAWNGDSSLLSSRPQEPNLRSQHFVEKGSLHAVKQLGGPQEEHPGDTPRSVHSDNTVVHIQGSEVPAPETATDDGQLGSPQQEPAGSSQAWGGIPILIVVLLCLVAVYYHSSIYTLSKNLVSYVASRFSSSYRNKKDYNIIGERNDFDFLNNSASDDEDQDGGDHGLDTLSLRSASPGRNLSPRLAYKTGSCATHSSPARPRKLSG